jgi:type IV pilus assembly protein PilY1
MRNRKLQVPYKKLCGLFGIALPLVLAALPARSNTTGSNDTDLSNVPLATQTTVVAKPNLMFILDDSGSMAWSYMPDTLGASDQPYYNWFGYYSSQCNGVAFDPTAAYPPPLKADGSSYPNAEFTAAPDDGYVANSARPNLTNNFYYTYSGAEARMNWTYTSTYVVNTGTNFYKECATRIDPSKNDSATPGSFSTNAKFTKVLAKDLTAEAKQAYANWYSYYRKRYLLMRTAMGRAVAGLDSGYRVGFSRINSTSVTDGTGDFRDAKDFDSTQKANFYATLYGVSPNGGTPLPAALSRIGRYYAKKETGQKYDPMQYSCQRNFALLSTDGYWNSGSNSDLSGNTVGDQDGSEVRPMLDAAKAPNTLADVAEYYYRTDLRTSALGNCTSGSSNQNVCENTVRPVGDDKANWQHMNTFTIGLGVSGVLTYDPNYLTQTSGAYAQLKAGTSNWPNPSGGGDVRAVDDLWHAAVNGRGQYYSALSATALKDAINGVISAIQATEGSGSATAITSLELTSGDNNLAFQAGYSMPAWTGDIQAFSLNGGTGSLGTTALWSAQSTLDATPVASRNIYFRNAGGALASFTYGNLNATQQAYFDGFCTRSPMPDQCASLSASDLAIANKGTNLVDYLRGVRTYETAGTAGAPYRRREHVLGDIIDSNPTFVGRPPFIYADPGYGEFMNSAAARNPMIYVGANDGMLHAFSATAAGKGSELWAYVPGPVIPNLYRLADTRYPMRHEYFVNGPLVVGDIRVGSTWKTILVGGLGAGGKGYYAIDVTNPSAPTTLWEFTDANMGYSFGKPIIAKRADGTWVVAVTSGYNNNVGGDGQGHFYLLDAATGALLLNISTGVGNTSSPSGLAQINAWVPSSADNTAARFYGGDLAGNLWRFDIDGLVAPERGALRLANFTVNGTPQPITTKPELVEVSGQPVVLVGTGRYLGVSDISDPTQQSIYAVRDPLTATGWGDVRNSSRFVRQTLSLNSNSATGTKNAIDWKTAGGWMADLPHSKERVVINPTVQYTTLAVATAIPSGDACASGGSSWLYYFDFTSGGALPGQTIIGQQVAPAALIVGLTWTRDASGKIRLIRTKSDRTADQDDPPLNAPASTITTNRTSWRELID